MIVKQTIGKVISIFEKNNVELIYAGCESFDCALKLAEKGLRNKDAGKPFDSVMVLPMHTAVPESEEVLCEEQIATLVRNDVSGEPIAVLITDDEIAFGGVDYQFLYPGDNVEVMTDHGIAVATFHRVTGIVK